MVGPGFAGLHQRLTRAAAAGQGGAHRRMGSLAAAQHAQAVVAIARHGIEGAEFIHPLAEIRLYGRKPGQQGPLGFREID